MSFEVKCGSDTICSHFTNQMVAEPAEIRPSSYIHLFVVVPLGIQTNRRMLVEDRLREILPNFSLTLSAEAPEHSDQNSCYQYLPSDVSGDSTDTINSCCSSMF